MVTSGGVHNKFGKGGCGKRAGVVSDIGRSGHNRLFFNLSEKDNPTFRPRLRLLPPFSLFFLI